ncbi:MAG: hypothetical protein JSR83_13650 [Proteobacteria bacterium]|nr:hypothetical protein [Pseudomonadota bacterium]
MIESFISDYRRSDRDIDALTYVVIVFLVLIIGRAVLLIYERQYSAFWQLLPYFVPLLSVLVVVRVANRLLLNGNIIREDDRRQEIVRATHHLIAIAGDLKARVGYLKAMFIKEGYPSIALVQIAKSIEGRYETLLQRDAYKYLPGSCVDIITCMSGDIFGIVVLAEGVRQANSEKLALTPIPVSWDSPLPPRFDELMKDLQQLIDQLFEVRRSIEVKKGVS